SSRRRHTRCLSDWSSDVCSSDLVYIAPLIFGLAPVINVLVSMVWHPKAGEPFNFGLEIPGWKLWLGIVLVGAGAALVLFSKEERSEERRVGKECRARWGAGQWSD